jgi:AraC-like DNA-binding protein
MLVFVVLIMQKKFRQIPAVYWGILSFVLVIHFLVVALYEYAIIEKLSMFLLMIGGIRALVIPLLYLTFNSHINKDYTWNFPKLKFFLPAVPLYVAFIVILILPNKGDLFWESSPVPRYFFLIAQLYIGVAFFYISKRNFAQVKSATASERNEGYQGIKQNSPLVGYLRFISLVMLLHGILILMQLFNHLIYGAMVWTLIDQMEQFFWLLIGLVFVYKFVSYPVSLYQFELKNQEIPSEKYKGEMLDPEQIKPIIKRLNEYMLEEKPFLDPNYSISQLSQEMEISSRELSKLMNQYLNQNFHDYINNFRIEEFKRLVKDPGNSKFSILSLSMDSGFRSKSTFNTAFKKFTGTTPSRYCKSIKG